MVDISNGVTPTELVPKRRKRSKSGSSTAVAAATASSLAVTSSPAEQLRERVKAENEYIRCLVDSIPPTFYFTAQILESIDYHGHQQVAEDTANGQPKGAVSKKWKQKRRDRLNEEESKTNRILGEVCKDQKANSSSKKLPRVGVNGRTADVRLNSMDELKARLQSKLTQLRGVVSTEEEDFRLKKRLKRRLSKHKMKERRKRDKAQLSNGGGASADGAKTAPTKPAHTPTKPIFNQEGKMVFSKFDFSDGSGARDSRKRGQFEGKNYKSLLDKVQQQSERIRKLEVAGDAERAGQLKEKLQWQAVLEKAAGLKVKNDPVQLERAARRAAKRKEGSAKKWEGRVEHVSGKREAQQKRRSANLQTRKKDKIKSKIKKAVKRGRLVPGFS